MVDTVDLGSAAKAWRFESSLGHGFIKMKKFCVVTYVHNENFFLPIWLNYYSKIFSPNDIYVIDNNTSDNSITNAKQNFDFNLIDFPTEHNQSLLKLFDFVHSFVFDLLNQYDGIYVAEVDEIIYHPSGLINIANYYSDRNFEAVRCYAYEPIHNYFQDEPEIKFDINFLQQRKFWRHAFSHHKIVFITDKINFLHEMHIFSTATHSIADYKLSMIHLKFIDYKMLYKRNFNTLLIGNIDPITEKLNYGWQNRINKLSEFDDLFKFALHMSYEIPESFKNII